MNILVVGCGMMGRAVIRDLCRYGNPERILAVDHDVTQIREAEHFISDLNPRNIKFQSLDIRKTETLSRLMKQSDTVVSAVTYRYNLELTRLAIRHGCHFCDLGGNNTIVQEQFQLNAQAVRKGVTVIPDCGLAPGMVSVLTAHAVQYFDRTEEVRIRVGGLPVHPKPPMNYQIVFSVYGLINEYTEPCLQLRNGKIVTVEPMQDVEEIRFSKPFGQLEAFNTSGGASTLPFTYQGKIKNLDYKTIRYPGHCRQFRLLMDLGLTDPKKVKYDNKLLSPRDVLATHLLKTLTGHDPDCILLRVTAEGVRKNRKQRLIYECIDYGEPEVGVTAMMRMTAYPVSIIAQMMSKRIITESGVIPQELCVPPDMFIAELRRRGIRLTIQKRKL